jgi:hypothetical protein|nr:MAG TPA: Protein of unknown function (DUF2612) [Caudoviricetes sp.]
MNYLTLLNELENYYANLLIVQYNGKPKAASTIKTLTQLVWVNMILLQIRDAFDWKTAKGNPLDIIGQWVGLDKFYKGQLFDFHAWFALIDWDKEGDNLQGGFSTFDNFETLKGGFLDYQNILPTQNQLSVEQYRILIGLKIIKNNIEFTCKNIDDAIWNYFEGQIYTTWRPMEVTYHYPSEMNVIMEVALDENVLLAPTGVNIILQEIIENA